jgi:hypothetical protein
MWQFHREQLVKFIRIALASLRYPTNREEAITLAAEGLLIGDIDVSAATCLMAARCRTVP